MLIIPWHISRISSLTCLLTYFFLSRNQVEIHVVRFFRIYRIYAHTLTAWTSGPWILWRVQIVRWGMEMFNETVWRIWIWLQFRSKLYPFEIRFISDIDILPTSILWFMVFIFRFSLETCEACHTYHIIILYRNSLKDIIFSSIPPSIFFCLNFAHWKLFTYF